MSPGDARVAQPERGEKHRFAVKGRGEGVEAIPGFDLAARISAVLGFDPDDGGRGIRAPGEGTRSLGYRIEGDGHLLGQGQVGQLADHFAVPVPDPHSVRKTMIGNQIGEGTMQGLGQQVRAVRRRSHRAQETGRTYGLHVSV